MGKEKFKNFEEFAAAYEKFYENHPEAPIAEDVECLNLIMKKVYAEQILAGTKKLEFREYKDFYIKRLIDRNVADYIRANINNEDVLTFCNDIRHVKKIHFHDYNKSWYLDIECTQVGVFSITKQDIENLHKNYGCHDFDEDLRRLDAMKVPENRRPWIFYLICGKVLDTNLQGSSKKDENEELCGGDIFTKPVKVEAPSESSNLEIIKFKVKKSEFEGYSNFEQNVFTEEINSQNLSQFFILDDKNAVKEINGIPQFKRYDAIQFIYKDESCTRLINNADIAIMDEEYGELIPYSELEDDIDDFNGCFIAYTLGEIIKQNE